MYKLIDDNIEQDRAALISVATIEGVGHYVSPMYSHSSMLADGGTSDSYRCRSQRSWLLR